jgi:hypothetical protein
MDVKQPVIEADEFDRGPRLLLNYGHTFAHAFETAAGYGTLLHGEAVSIGMAAAARLAAQLGRIGTDVVARQDALLANVRLPVDRAGLAPVAADDLLAAIAAKRHVMGGAGAGARAKLALNLVLGLNRAALAEGLAFSESLDLDGAAFLSLLRDSPAYSAAMDAKGAIMLEGRFSPPQARIAQHRKDLGLMLAEAGRLGQPIPLGAVHAALLDAAIEAGDADLDNSAVLRQLRRMRHKVNP